MPVARDACKTPSTFRRCDGTVPSPAKFYSLTTWNCEKGAEWVNCGAIQFHDFVMVNNEFAGIEMKLIKGTPWGEDKGALVKNAVIVGRNTASPAQDGSGIVSKTFFSLLSTRRCQEHANMWANWASMLAVQITQRTSAVVCNHQSFRLIESASLVMVFSLCLVPWLALCLMWWRQTSTNIFVIFNHVNPHLHRFCHSHLDYLLAGLSFSTSTAAVEVVSASRQSRAPVVSNVEAFITGLKVSALKQWFSTFSNDAPLRQYFVYQVPRDCNHLQNN